MQQVRGRVTAVRVVAVVLLVGIAGGMALRARAPRVTRELVAVGGREISVERSGDGPDVLVLAGPRLAHLAPHLAGGRRVTTVPAAVAHAERARPLAALLSHLGIAGDAQIVGAPRDLVPLVVAAPPSGSAIDLVAVTGPDEADGQAVDQLIASGVVRLSVFSSPSSPVWRRLRHTAAATSVRVSLLAACDRDVESGCLREVARLLLAARSKTPMGTGQVVRDGLRSGGEGPSMVVIPAGQFWASPPGEAPQALDRLTGHGVRVGAPLAVARSETTVGEFRRFVAASGHRPGAGCWSHTTDQEWKLNDAADWAAPGFDQTDDHPVTCMTFDDAAAYAAWLSGETGQRYRLPTESEFEFVNRGGRYGEYAAPTTEVTGLCGFVNGADRSSRQAYANDCDDGFEATAPVGRYPPNDFGLVDTTGNLWELTSDCWRLAHLRLWDQWRAARWPDTLAAPRSCPGRHVVRGGAFLSSPANLRLAQRDVEGFRSNRVGFRVVRELP